MDIPGTRTLSSDGPAPPRPAMTPSPSGTQATPRLGHHSACSVQSQIRPATPSLFVGRMRAGSAKSIAASASSRGWGGEADHPAGDSSTTRGAIRSTTGLADRAPHGARHLSKGPRVLPLRSLSASPEACSRRERHCRVTRGGRLVRCRPCGLPAAARLVTGGSASDADARRRPGAAPGLAGQRDGKHK